MKYSTTTSPLETGTMRIRAKGLTAPERMAVASYLSSGAFKSSEHTGSHLHPDRADPGPLVYHKKLPHA